MLAQHPRKLRFRTMLALLTVFALLVALCPSDSARTEAASAPFTLSQTAFTVGYSGTTVTVTGDDAYPISPTTTLDLYDRSGQNMQAIDNVTYLDNHHLTFTLEPGVPEGTYSLYVKSYGTAYANISILSSFDPSNVRVSPGVNRDIRLDWVSPGGTSNQQVIIKYGPINALGFTNVASAPLANQTFTLTGLQNKTAYKFQLSTRKPDGTETPGVYVDNNGQGYLAIDTTPPGDLTQIAVTAVQNGFQVHWTDPTDSDLNLINVQYAEHGTSLWSTGVVVQKGVQQALLTPINTSKRYDLRFTKTDSNGNWSYQIDNHNGYGYTSDTTAPADVQLQPVSASSDDSAALSWYDPADTDFHHVNIYLSSSQTDWKLIGHADKGVQAYTLTGLAPNINYNVKVTALDDKGNESAGVISTFVTNSTTDPALLGNVAIAQEPQGGLQLTWDSTQIQSVDFSKFKMYYAPISSGNANDYRQTVPSAKTATGAFLRDMPRGTYKLQMRLFDSLGIEQAIGTYLNENAAGYYVSGNGGVTGPEELANVRIQPTTDQNLQISWDPASTDGTSVEIFYAVKSTDSSNWMLAGKVDKSVQQFKVTGLESDLNYFFKLVVVDDTQNTTSPGVIYDNGGYGFNALGGDTHAPGEVTNYNATASFNSILVSYDEPTDSDFDSAKIYVMKKDSSDVITTVTAQKGSAGATIPNLLPNIPYVLLITTVDTYGNESAGVLLDNNGNGFTLSGSGVGSPSEVQNALLVPSSTQMTVRFQDPLIADYDHALVSIKPAGSATYTLVPVTVHKGSNEVTFYNLAPNQPYTVHIATVTASGHTSTGIDLGGTTGVGLTPIPDPTQAVVTPGNNRLTVAWQAPANTVPTQYQVQLQALGTTQWSDPMIVDANTKQVVFHGLANDKAYNVRISTVINGVSSPGLQPGDGSGFSARAASIVVTPGSLQAGANSQVLSILGTNTRFPWANNQVSLHLYDSNNQDVSYLLTGLAMYGQTRMDVTFAGPLTQDRYRLELQDPADGKLATFFDVLSEAPNMTLTSASTTSASLGYSAFTMFLTGSGFSSGTQTIWIDNTTRVTATVQDSGHLWFTMPTGLLPGAHMLSLGTNSTTATAIGFNVYPFSASGTLAVPTTRSSAYAANFTVSNLDQYARNVEVLLVIRRNGLYVETKSATATFAALESKAIKFTFGGGANSPYANGPTSSISLQAYVVDQTNLAPLSAPILLTQDVNL